MKNKTMTASAALSILMLAFFLQSSDTKNRAYVFTPWEYYSRYSAADFKNYGPANKPIDFNNIDYPLLQAAVFYETNRVRQEYGKPLFIHADALERSAMMHAMDMAEDDFFSHENPYNLSKRAFTDRIGMFGGQGAAENIAVTFGIQYNDGEYVYDIGSIPPHTYNSFAEVLVDVWMNSPGHRANILDQNGYGYKDLGCGVYLKPKDEWRSMYSVQNFGYNVPE